MWASNHQLATQKVKEEILSYSFPRKHSPVLWPPGWQFSGCHSLLSSRATRAHLCEVTKFSSKFLQQPQEAILGAKKTISIFIQYIHSRRGSSLPALVLLGALGLNWEAALQAPSEYFPVSPFQLYEDSINSTTTILNSTSQKFSHTLLQTPVWGC